MITGKSIAMIRAACSITAGSAAASLGHETRPLSIQTPTPKSRRHFLTTAAAPTATTTPTSSDPTTLSSTHTPSPSSTAAVAEEWNPFSPSHPLPNDADRLETFNNAVHTICGDAGAGGCGSVGNGAVGGVAASAVNEAGTAVEDMVVDTPSVLNSIRYWAQLFKTFNGLYGGGGGMVGGVENGGGGCDAASHEEEEQEGAAAFSDNEDTTWAPKKCCFCQSVPSFTPSPSSFKNTTLNTVTGKRLCFWKRLIVRSSRFR